MSDKTKLSEKQVIRLVAEVSKLEQEKKQLVERDQVADILRELDLPDGLLDEAMQRLAEQDRVQAEQDRVKHEKQGRIRRIVLIGAIVLGLGAATFSASYVLQSHQASDFAKVGASEARIVLDADRATTLTEVTAGQGGQVAAVTTLTSVPLHQRLPMRAMWLKPDGSVYHENSWLTKETTKPTWDTHARCLIDSAAPHGPWEVKVFLNDRLLTTKDFVVK